ncbi:MAG: ABC transporter permease [Planctomycetes bacterium]|nr:ABC transporter permease [Planctomycetota bacterium]
MLLGENVRIALAELKANPFRSGLTTLGIVIAVSAVIAVVSVIQGASYFLMQQFEGMGSNTMWVVPQRPPGDEGQKLGRVELTYEDTQAVAERCRAVATVAPAMQRGATVEAFGQAVSTRVVGATPELLPTRNLTVDGGRFFSPQELTGAARVVVVGEEIVTNLNSTRERLLGRSIRIDGQPFRVIGFFEKRGSVMGESQDNFAAVPITTSFLLFGPSARRRVMFTALSTRPDDPSAAVDQIRWLLRLRHGLRRGDPDDFMIYTQDQILDTIGNVSAMITAVFAGIVSVALLVGGIGIMNIMLVSVTERTREIGVRKALGAKNKDVLLQFLVEAATLGMLGGFLGVALGWGMGTVTQKLISLKLDFPPVHIPWWAVALALGFSSGVGLASGLYPAWKASRLDPIDALRHE